MTDFQGRMNDFFVRLVKEKPLSIIAGVVSWVIQLVKIAGGHRR